MTMPRLTRASHVPAKAFCPVCDSQDTHILRVRCRSRDQAIVRRHECWACLSRFTSEQRTVRTDHTSATNSAFHVEHAADRYR
jgi:transcriptional regulator NrdR family protein